MNSKQREHMLEALRAFEEARAHSKMAGRWASRSDWVMAGLLYGLALKSHDWGQACVSLSMKS